MRQTSNSAHFRTVELILRRDSPIMLQRSWDTREDWSEACTVPRSTARRRSKLIATPLLPPQPSLRSSVGTTASWRCHERSLMTKPDST
jgi:hypothetical protein